MSIKKYIDFLILLVPVIFTTTTMIISMLILSIAGLPLFIGAWLLGWVQWDDYLIIIIWPLAMLKDLFDSIK